MRSDEIEIKRLEISDGNEIDEIRCDEVRGSEIKRIEMRLGVMKLEFCRIYRKKMI